VAANREDFVIIAERDRQTDRLSRRL